MKKLVIISLALISISAFAKSNPNNFNQRNLLCAAVDGMLETEQADAAVDMKKCRTNAEVSVKEQSDGSNLIVGLVPFNSPNRSFSEMCQVSYKGFFEKGVLIGEISDVECF